MDRRSFLAVTASLLGTPLAVEAQQPTKIPRIAFLAPAPSGSVATGVQPFLAALRELGWVEGQNIVVEYRWTEGRSDRLAPIMSDLIALKVDLEVHQSIPPRCTERGGGGGTGARITGPTRRRT